MTTRVAVRTRRRTVKRRVKRDEIRSVAIYARLSLSTEESVSIERQIESARLYAASRKWRVVLVATDDGVSASKVRPEEREGWCSLLDAKTHFDAVIVWKVDRLARKVRDFLIADEMLQERRAALVAVEDPVDMTTGQGRAFATMLSVFAEMEADAIGARASAARPTLLRQGRRPGQRPPYGWKNVPNPKGPGVVFRHDPERIPHVRQAVELAIEGQTLAAIARYLTEHGAPRVERKGRVNRHWTAHRVEELLRNPTLAGMTPYNPGRQPGEKGTEVLRGDDGMPILFEEVALLSTDEFRVLQARLDERKIPGGRPRIGEKDSLLSGLLYCASCGKRLHRNGSASYGCQWKDCPDRMAINRPRVEEAVTEYFLRVVGPRAVVDVLTIAAEPVPLVGDLEDAVKTLTARLADDLTDAEEDEILARVRALKARLREAREAAPVQPDPEVIEYADGRTFAEVWHAATTDNEKRALLSKALDHIVVKPGQGRGRNAAPASARLEYHWQQQNDESLLRDYAGDW